MLISDLASLQMFCIGKNPYILELVVCDNLGLWLLKSKVAEDCIPQLGIIFLVYSLKNASCMISALYTWTLKGGHSLTSYKTSLHTSLIYDTPVSRQYSSLQDILGKPLFGLRIVVIQKIVHGGTCSKLRICKDQLC